MPNTKFMNAVNALEKVIGALLLAVLLVVMVIQIFGRSLGLVVTWTDELSRFLFVYIVYIGSAYSVLLDKHIRIDIMISIWPKAIHKYLELIGSIASFAFCAFVFFYTTKYNLGTILPSGRFSPSLGISMAIPNFAVNLGYFLMLLRLLQTEIIPRCRGIARKSPEPEGGNAQ